MIGLGSFYNGYYAMLRILFEDGDAYIFCFNNQNRVASADGVSLAFPAKSVPHFSLTFLSRSAHKASAHTEAFL